MRGIAAFPRRMSQGDLGLRALSIRHGPRLREILAELVPANPPWGWISLWFWVRRTFKPAFVVLHEGRAIGFVGLYDLELGRSCKISMAMGDRRRQGYGRRVFRLLCRGLSEHGVVGEILAEVEPGNSASTSFLESLGFEEAGTENGLRILRYEVE